jgi:hypothetical protein
MTIPKLLLLSMLACIAHPALGVEVAPWSALLSQASEKRLAQHPYWHKLLHYRNSAMGSLKSDIVSQDFFLSPGGAGDPELELEATLRAFFAPSGNDQDAHAQCRFVARYRWLRAQMDWRDAVPPSVSCKAFEAWSGHGSVTSISVMFATGYFSNPASYYGHLLLRFNTTDGMATLGLLDQTLNFGAIVPEGEPGLVYVAKGVFGGYEAAFSSVQFYRHNHSYAEEELRDMWAYDLELESEEVARIVAHSWELLHARFDYYFAKENCAYRMAELLELVVEQPLLYESLPWSAPGTVFDHLVTLEKDGRPLIRKVTRIPSRLNRFHVKYRRLTPASQAVLRNWAKGAGTFEGGGYAALGEGDKIAVVDALVDYVEFRRVLDKKDVFADKAKRALLLERLKLPSRAPSSAGELKPGDVQQELPPHFGPRPNMVRAGTVSNEVLGHGMTLNLHPAYFDRLSIDAGHIPHATLEMFDLELVAFGQSLRLRRLDVVNLEHMNISRTLLPGDGGYAWRIRFGLQSHDLSCTGCLVGKVAGGLGKAVALPGNAVAFIMATGDLQTPHAGSGNAGAAGAVGVMIAPAAIWKTSVELGGHVFLNGTRARTSILKWQNRLGGDRDWDVRLDYERDAASQWRLVYSAYW